MNFSKCPDELYIDSSEFNSILYHSTSVIDIPLNLFVIYLIITCSSRKMKNIKTTLLALQLWSTVSDLMLGTLVVPYVAFPLIGYRPTGFLQIFDVSPVVQTHVTILFIAQVGACIVFMFENRHHHIVKKSHSDSSTVKRVCSIILNVFGPFITELILFLNSPKDLDVRAYILENIDCPAQDLLSSPIFIISKSRNLAALLLTIDLTFYTVQIAFYIGSSSRSLRKSIRDTSVSARTRMLRRKFYYSVCVQTLIPFVNIALPAVFCVVIIFNSYYNQALNNLCIFAMSTHGLVGSIAIILVYKEYRTKVGQVLFRGKIYSSRDVQYPTPAIRDSADRIIIYN